MRLSRSQAENFKKFVRLGLSERAGGGAALDSSSGSSERGRLQRKQLKSSRKQVDFAWRSQKFSLRGRVGRLRGRSTTESRYGTFWTGNLYFPMNTQPPNLKQSEKQSQYTLLYWLGAKFTGKAYFFFLVHIVRISGPIFYRYRYN